MKNNRMRSYDESRGIEVKKCSRCHVEKPISEFYSNGKSGYYHGKCKECDLIVKKMRYDANPEKYRAAVMQSARKYPERVHARRQQWGIANKEHCLQYYREYNETHREERRAFDRERHSKETPEFRHMWYERRHAHHQEYTRVNSGRLNAYSRLWAKTFPEKCAEKEQRRRARKRNAPQIEKIDRKAVIERDNWTCYLCEQICTPQNVTLDHVIPLFRSGTHTADNLRVACRSCNARKSTKLLHEFLK